MSDTLTTMREISMELARQQEALILEQLGDLVKKGLLVMEVGPTQITRDAYDPDPYKLKATQSVRFHLKDAERMAALEKENFKLKMQLDMIKKGVEGLV